jgi:murein DD-endopeptidase MepM/ murein hydrolase activator NlpD
VNGSRSVSGIFAGGLLVAAVACAPVYSGIAVHSAAPPIVPRSAVEATGTDPALVRALEALVWPLAADGDGILSSTYGERIHPRAGEPRFHGGLDLRAREGTPVYASAGGVVSASESSGAYGNLVVVDHGGGMQTLYAHNSRNLVHVGEAVRRGQPIAMVGHTGNATGNHVHFEVRWKGGTVDPRTVLPLLSGLATR